jgi:WD40 repeat protein
MSKPRATALVVLTVAALIGPAAPGQTGKPAPLPPVNPAAARLEQTISGLDGPGWAIAVGGDGGLLAVACEHDALHFWNRDALLGFRAASNPGSTLRGHGTPVTHLVWHGGPVLASASAEKILIRSALDGKLLHTLPSPRTLRALALSEDGKVLASAGDDPDIQLWDAATGKPGAVLKDHKDWVLALAFSPDGKLLASGGHDGLVRLWDVESGKKVRDLPGTQTPPPKVPADPIIVSTLCFSPDGKTVAVGTTEGPIQFINVADGKLVRPLAGHNSVVTGLAFHPRGDLLVSASRDRTLRLWNPANGQVLKVLEGHAAWVQGVVFLAQGTRLASVGADQTVRIWDLTEPAKK